MFDRILIFRDSQRNEISFAENDQPFPAIGTLVKFPTSRHTVPAHIRGGRPGWQTNSRCEGTLRKTVTAPGGFPMAEAERFVAARKVEGIEEPILAGDPAKLPSQTAVRLHRQQYRPIEPQRPAVRG